MNPSLPQAYIQFVSGPLAEQIFPLSDGEVWIGSHPRNHIVIPDQTIQLWHARLAWNQGRLLIQSYQESPIMVNRKSVPGSSYILNGDEISLGQANIAFRLTLDTTTQQNDIEAQYQQSGSYATPAQSGSYATLQQSGSYATPAQSGNNTMPAQDEVQIDFPQGSSTPAAAQDEKTVVAFPRRSGAFPALLSNRARATSPQDEAQVTFPQSNTFAASLPNSADAAAQDEMTLVPFYRSGAMPRVAPPQNNAFAAPQQDEKTLVASWQGVTEAPPQQNEAFDDASKGQMGTSGLVRVIDPHPPQRDSGFFEQSLESHSQPDVIPGMKNSEQYEAFTSSAHTEITRYLCAAAHLDEKFRRYVLKHIVRDAHRDLGEAYGVDIIPVVKWCFAAQKRTFIRDMLLFGVLLGILILMLLEFSGISHLLHLSPAALYAGPNPYPGYKNSITSLTLFASSVSPFILIPILLVLQFLFITLIVAAVRFARPSLHRGTFYLMAYLLFYPTTLLPLYLVAWIVVTVEKVLTYYGPKRALLTKSEFRPGNIQVPIDAALERDLKENFNTQDRNVVVHNGHAPFAGAGIRVGGWSFAVDVSKGRQAAGKSLTPLQFQVNEIYDYMAGRIEALNLSMLINVSLEDKLFVNGQEIRNDKRFLDNPFVRPRTWIEPSLMKAFIEDPSQDIRYYKCVRVTSWRGDLVLSIFLRFLLVEKNLFIEADYLLLPPLAEEYSQIDTLELKPGVPTIWKLAKQSFFATLPLLLRSPGGVLSWAFKDGLAQQERKRLMHSIENNPTFDYGASSNPRQFASASNYRSFFQRLDKEMYVKIIERQILEGFVNFLEARNIDATDLKVRALTILKNGVMVSEDAL